MIRKHIKLYNFITFYDIDVENFIIRKITRNYIKYIMIAFLKSKMES